jgi:LmbE family N-acetylglucosaminyl deacetylase
MRSGHIDHPGDTVADLVVLAPHMDDETLGCGGLIATAEDPLVVFGVTSRDEGIEVDEVAKELGFRYKVLYGADYEARMLDIDRRELVGHIEEILGSERPRRVCIPSPSYHQDHAVMFESGLAATRPLSRKGYLAPMVSAYEYPGSAWGYDGREMELNHYVDITSVMDRKLQAVACYNGSQRGRAVIDPDVVTGWARLRGAFVGVEFAEAFRLMRMVESA